MTPYRHLRQHARFPRAARFSFVAAVALLAVLSPFAAAGHAGEAAPCITVDAADMAPAVAQADVIVVGEVARRGETSPLVIAPQVFLKGPAEAADIALELPERDSPCGATTLVEGERAVLFLTAAGGSFAWPGEHAVVPLTGDEGDAAEVALTGRIRDLTGQFAVPAKEGGGAMLSLRSAVLPVGLGLLVLFAIGLVLMRIWHRIDPT